MKKNKKIKKRLEDKGKTARERKRERENEKEEEKGWARRREE